MEKNNYKVLAVAALIIAVVALTVGFASFSTVLSIQNASAEVQPTDLFTPNVQFSQGTGGAPNVTCGNSHGDSETVFVNSKGSLNDSTHATVWRDASVTLTGPGDYVTCAIDMENNSPFIAYLYRVDLSSVLTCTPVAGTTQNVNQACAELQFDVLLPNENAYATSTVVHNAMDVRGAYLNPGDHTALGIRIRYSDSQHAATAARADGDFIVNLPNITIYGSTEATSPMPSSTATPTPSP